MDFPIHSDAVEYLSSMDPALGRLMNLSGPVHRGIEPDPFTALASAIVAQQLSASAADTIWARFQTLAGSVTPERISVLSEADMRACGLSFQKIGYIRNIADAFLSVHLSDALFNTANDEQITQALTAVKGIGRWTAEMFLIFCLGRADVFSYGDLGLRKGMGWLRGLPGEPAPELAKAVSALWSPYASTASLYLWEVTLRGLYKQAPAQALYPEFAGISGETGTMDSPIGPLKIVSSPLGLTEVSLCASAAHVTCSCPLIAETKKQLDAYFRGTRRVFDLPLAPGGDDANRVVWAALRTVSFGERTDAKSLANRAGKSFTAQTVSAANKKSRLLILVPSHRLVRADGRAVDSVQQWLLSHEAATSVSG